MEGDGLGEGRSRPGGSRRHRRPRLAAARPRRAQCYLDIAEVIESTSAHATRELRELWRRIVFSVLISNTDDHLRNHGFLHDRGEVWRLAPAFDLNPDPTAGTTYLSTAISHADDRADLALALSVADRFRLPDAQARATMLEVAHAVSAWREVAGQHGRTPRELEQMAPAFDALDGPVLD